LCLSACFIGCDSSSTRPDVEAQKNSSPALTISEPATQAPPEQAPQDFAANPPPKPADQTQALVLFDGKTLAGWQVTEFGGQGECLVKDGVLVLEPGAPLTGLTSTRTDLPTSNYEIELEARKVKGIDFFCGLTFPVADSHCSLIVGGWAGSVVGLSMIDDQDANNNQTRRLKKFETDRWYRIRLSVTNKRIRAWIDDEEFVDQDIAGHRLSVRNETLPSRPLGICSFETQAEIRNFELKLLSADEPLVNEGSSKTSLD
jgi:hypothetical protein